MKKTLIIFAIIIAGTIFWYLFVGSKSPNSNGNTAHNTEITYVNASDSLIHVTLPFPDAVVGKKFSVIGEARGSWFFEASFPVMVIGKDGVILDQRPAMAKGEWMTENFVPFQADMEIPETYIGPAKLILKNDNPSGETSRERSMSFDINIEY